MSNVSETQCRWCRRPAEDEAYWMRFRSKFLPLCPECALNIKQVLKVGNHLARMVGEKLRAK